MTQQQLEMDVKHKPLEGFQILRPLLPKELRANTRLLSMLVDSINEDPWSQTLSEIELAIRQRETVVWTWGQGLMCTTFKITHLGPMCYITNVRGWGFLRNLAKIDADVTSLCKSMGAKYILGEVPSKALARAYERRGGQILSRVLRKVD